MSPDFVDRCLALAGRAGGWFARPKVSEAIPLVWEYYAEEGNGAGGSLHIVLDDNNVRDDCVEFCRQWAEDHDDTEGVALATVLARMSRTQRAKLAGLPKREAPVVRPNEVNMDEDRPPTKGESIAVQLADIVPGWRGIAADIDEAIRDAVAARDARWQAAVGMPLEQAEENAAAEGEAFDKLMSRGGTSP